MNMVAFALPLVCLVLLGYIDGVILPRRKARRAKEAAAKRRLAAEGAAIDGQSELFGSNQTTSGGG